MVIANINDVKPEYFTSKNIRTAIEFIKTHDMLALPSGKTVIDGDNVYVTRSSYIGKKFEDSKLEGHQKYMDLQYVIKGIEGMGYVDIKKKGIKVIMPYDPIKDREFYDAKLDGIINLEGGYFALVLPSDLHKPNLKVNDDQIEKAVFKIKIDF